MTTPDPAKAAEIFHVSRSSDGDGEWFSARDPASGIIIPARDRADAYSLTAALNQAFEHHMQRPTDTARAGDELASYEKFDGVGSHDETIETRARIGESYLDAYYSALTDPRLKGYTPADCPSELLLDMLHTWEPATPSPVTDETALSGEAPGIATVEMVETVQAWPPGEPAEPIWRIQLGEYCADFCHEQAARNFASAINAALASTPQPSVSGEVADVGALWRGVCLMSAMHPQNDMFNLSKEAVINGLRQAALASTPQPAVAECPFCTGPVPDSPLQKLGAYLADLLDEDKWATAEQYLNAAIRQTALLGTREAK